MAQTIWKGWLSFGLVSIPVRLFRAVEEKAVRFREIDRGSGRAVRHRRVVDTAEPARAEEAGTADGPVTAQKPAGVRELPAPSGGARAEDVEYEQLLKGYELPSGEMVTIDREELEAIAPEQTRTIEIVEFVQLAEIDPIYFDRSYYVVPQDVPQARRAYGLLLQAMEETSRVAVGSFVLRTREHLAAIRPVRGALCLVTLHYADEVRSPRDVGHDGAPEEAPAREVRLAEQLIGALSATWDPARHRDAYRDRVLRLIEERLNAGEVLPAAARPGEAVAEPVDLMAALKASVDAIATAIDM